jgi:hypothetical protein
VASVSVTLGAATLSIGGTTQATATVKDVAGNVLTGRAIGWTSSNSAVATINATTGVVTAVAAGTVNITATSEGQSGFAPITVGAGPDLTPPSIIALTVSPLTVDVTAGAKTVMATARITDAGTGVKAFDFILTAPSGSLQAGCTTGTLVSGTAADGTWSCTATVPIGSAPGDWVIAVNAYDIAGNMQGLRTADLTARGFPTKVTVVSK